MNPIYSLFFTRTSPKSWLRSDGYATTILYRPDKNQHMPAAVRFASSGPFVRRNGIWTQKRRKDRLVLSPYKVCCLHAGGGNV